MRAAVVDDLPSDGFRLATVSDLQPEAPDDLIVRVEACGICGTDLHNLDGLAYRPSAFPFVLGHEPVGVVVAAGSDATGWIGRRITMTLFTGCGTCQWCRVGDERLCPESRGVLGATTRWGGFAELLRVPAAQAIDVPACLGPAEVATLVDAGATAANAVRALERLPDAPVVVGGGPVGFFVAELLRALGRMPVIVQRSPARAAMLRGLGYEVADSLEGYSGFPDVILECSGDPAVVPWALRTLQPRGLLLAAAYGVVDSLDTAPIDRKELTVRGVRSGSRLDLIGVLDAAATGRIRFPPIETWPLGGINDAIAALRARRVPGKAVIRLDA